MPPQISLRRSRIGWWVPLYAMPALLVLSAVLAVTKITPPGIGVIAFFWLLVQGVWAGGPTVTSRRQLPRVDRQRMLMTGRSWTGRRTLNLAELSSVRRVRWNFRSQYGQGRRVDYVILTDRSGVRLSMLRRTAVEPVQWALDYQREHGLPQARVSRFAAVGVGLAEPGDRGYQLARPLTIIAVAGGYGFVVLYLTVKVIPAMAGYHGG